MCRIPDDEEDAAGCVPGSRPRPLPQTTPSQRLRSAMELRMQQLYHTRDWSRSAAECIEVSTAAGTYSTVSSECGLFLGLLLQATPLQSGCN